MAQLMKKVGFAATVLIVLILFFNIVREPFRQREALDESQQAAITRATALYAASCLECHGAFGEGLNRNPALNTVAVRFKDYNDLFKTIERGRLNTAMIAYGMTEGGSLTSSQIDDLVTLIQHGSWRSVQNYIAAQGLTPTEVPLIGQQVDLTKLSYPLDVVTQGRDVFQANCISCHNLSVSGTTGHSIGKQLIGNQFVQQSTDDQLLAFIQTGRAANDPVNVTGYAMPARGGNPNLTDADIRSVIAYIRELNKGTANLTAVAATLDRNPIGIWQGVKYQWRKVVDHLDNPLFVTAPNDGSGRLFVVEQMGLIYIIQNGVLNPEPFLDITDLLPTRVYSGMYTEQGLLGMAFHPDFAKNGVFFISFTDMEADSMLVRYRVAPDNPNRADPNSAVTLLKVKQPYDDHKGGDIVFGPDGYLYMGFGDGGRPDLPNHYSQNPRSDLGKMLRLDVNDVNAKTYKIPPDNPFVGNPKYLPEIWALGLRNPWRFSFDRKTGDMYIADVGQWLYEELDFQPASSHGGENYGWSAFEGNHPYLKDEPVLGELTWPVIEYGHDAGQCITGGYVYRGQELPGLVGKYIYGDYINGRVWIAYRDVLGVWKNHLLMQTGFNPSSFGEDAQGEIYLVDYKGAVYRLTAVGKLVAEATIN